MIEGLVGAGIVGLFWLACGAIYALRIKPSDRNFPLWAGPFLLLDMLYDQ